MEVKNYVSCQENNLVIIIYNDLYSAISISNSFPKNVGTVIVKHSNPCGVSIEKNKIKSLRQAMKCDPISAFGGIVGM